MWRRDPPWAAIYARGVAAEPVALVAGRLFWGTDVRLLYPATAVIGEQPDGAAILDIPCGGGIALRGLRRGQQVRYVAADISDAMLERTTREAERRGVSEIVELRRADVEALPFDDGEFDLCVSFTGPALLPAPATGGHGARAGRPARRGAAPAPCSPTRVRYTPPWRPPEPPASWARARAAPELEHVAGRGRLQGRASSSARARWATSRHAAQAAGGPAGTR